MRVRSSTGSCRKREVRGGRRLVGGRDLAWAVWFWGGNVDGGAENVGSVVGVGVMRSVVGRVLAGSDNLA